MSSGSAIWAYFGFPPSVAAYLQVSLLIFVPPTPKGTLPVPTTVWVVQDGTFRIIGPWEWFACFRFGSAESPIRVWPPQWLIVVNDSVPIAVSCPSAARRFVIAVWPAPLQDVLYQPVGYEDLVDQYVQGTCSFQGDRPTRQHCFGLFSLTSQPFLPLALAVTIIS